MTGLAKVILVAALFFASVLPAFAVEPDEILSDPALEERARAISKNLRCLVCQNENIDSSHATLARDLRILVRERLVAGDSDQGDIIVGLVALSELFERQDDALDDGLRLRWRLGHHL